MNTRKSENDSKEKNLVEIESSTTVKQDRDYKGTFNPIYRQMMDEGLV